MKFSKLHVDFRAGTYGNFLAYILNRFVFAVPGSDFSPFTSMGTSHLGLTNEEYSNNKVVFPCHYSFKYRLITQSGNSQEILNNDGVIRLRVSNVYPVFYNTHIRAGDTPLDIVELEYNTLDKLSSPKFHTIRDTVLQNFGKHENYNRCELRNLFYSTFLDEETELKKFNTWIPVDNQTHYFCIDSIYNYSEFVKELGKVSVFAGKRGWTFDHKTLYPIWNEFIELNQGYNSYLKCWDIINNMLANDNVDINCNLFEEAYINSYITQTFNIYDGTECFGNHYPGDTLQLHHQITNRVKEIRNDL